MHYLTAWGKVVGSGTTAMHCHASLGAVGNTTLAMHYVTARAPWPVQLLQCTATLSSHCNSCHSLPQCLGAVGSGTLGKPAMHCLTATQQWGPQLLPCSATVTGGSGQWNFCNALHHRLGAVGSGTVTAWGLWAVQPLSCTDAVLIGTPGM